MGANSKIEWTDRTWNPLVGCEWASPGCDGCYAARDAAGRLSTNPTYAGLTVKGPDGRPRFSGEVRLLLDRLDQPLGWRTPQMVFVNSVSDLFHPDVQVEFIAEVWARMALTPQHTYQILTKRPQRMAAVLGSPGFRDVGNEAIDVLRRRPGMRHAIKAAEGSAWPLPNVWCGTSIESSKYLFRMRQLAEVPAAVRFLSIEPLIDNPFTRDMGPVQFGEALTEAGVGWVIVGGESGPQARPMHPYWPQWLRDACTGAGVPFFFKQWGEWEPVSFIPHNPAFAGEVINRPDMIAVHSAGMTAMTRDNPFNPFAAGHPNWVLMRRSGKKAAGRALIGRTWDEMPERQP